MPKHRMTPGCWLGWRLHLPRPWLMNARCPLHAALSFACSHARLQRGVRPWGSLSKKYLRRAKQHDRTLGMYLGTRHMQYAIGIGYLFTYVLIYSITLANCLLPRAYCLLPKSLTLSLLKEEARLQASAGHQAPSQKSACVEKSNMTEL